MRTSPNAPRSHQPATDEVYWTRAREGLSAGESCPGSSVEADPSFCPATSRASATSWREKARFIFCYSGDSSSGINERLSPESGEGSTTHDCLNGGLAEYVNPRET